MDIETYIGMAAAILTTIAFVPQLLKVYRTKQAEDISLKMYIAFVLGILLWLTYGIMRSDLPIIFANTITLILAAMIILLKLKFDKADKNN